MIQHDFQIQSRENSMPHVDIYFLRIAVARRPRSVRGAKATTLSCRATICGMSNMPPYGEGSDRGSMEEPQ